MKHNSTQELMFYLISHIDYSKKWDEIEWELGYNLGDYYFENPKSYDLVRQSIKSLWAVFNGKINSKGDIL